MQFAESMYSKTVDIYIRYDNVRLFESFAIAVKFDKYQSTPAGYKAAGHQLTAIENYFCNYENLLGPPSPASLLESSGYFL